MSSVPSSMHSCLWCIFLKLQFYVILHSLLGNSLVKVKLAIRQLVSKNLILFIRGAACRNKLQSYSTWDIHVCVYSCQSSANKLLAGVGQPF